MFVVTMASDFEIGDVRSAIVNGEDILLTYLDADHLQIGLDDVRQIIVHTRPGDDGDDLQTFYCQS